MVFFDLDTAAKALGNGSDPIDALSISFGLPQCLIDIGKSAALALLPSSLVLNIADQVQKGRDSADEDIAKLKKKLLLENGIFEIETENGTYRFLSDFSKNGLDEDGFAAIGKIAGLTQAVAYSLQTGADLYTNYLQAASIINGIGDCIGTYKTFLQYNKGPSSQIAKALDPNYLLDKFGNEVARLQNSVAFINTADTVLNNCRDIIARRLKDPELEPKFANADIVSGLGFDVNTSSVSAIGPLFRLVFGPPRSKQGQFLLSIDGLYYDSQTGGLPSVSAFVPPEQIYLFEQDPNLGGKGQAVSLKNLNKYIDTLFDLNSIDNSPAMQVQYDADHFLSVIEGQRSKNIYDLSAQIGAAIGLGYAETDAIIFNLRQSLYSVNARHESKINRRKKQIEIAIKAPYLFGHGTVFPIGEVPINDFSFLKDLNLAVAFESQKKLVFQQGEVSGVVLPLIPKFVKATEAESTVQMNHLVVPPMGTGSIIFDDDSIFSEPTVLSLNDNVITDKLLAIYNFLDGEVTDTGSNKFNVLNCNTTNNYNNAQLVGLSPSGVFRKGLAIPFLNGITKLTAQGNLLGVGSYVKLPDSTEFQNLLYNLNGFTFETWVNVPHIGESGHVADPDPVNGYGVSSFNRLLLACENTGGINENLSNPDQAPYSNNSDIVRGLVLGYSRDIQIISGIAPNDAEAANPASAGVFFIAPTRSVNASEVGYVNKASVINCASGYEVLKCSIPLSTVLSTGKSLFSASGEFMHMVVTVDVLKNSVNIYADSELVATSSLNDTFGIQPFTTPKIPSFKEVNSFEYSYGSTSASDFTNGPKLNQFFTPWIIGGGYSDGNMANGGFMNAHSGLKSGLKGYVGSIKIYAKALSNNEVKSNFDTQKGFFKNINLS